LGEDEKIEKYPHETSRKMINNPKLVTFNWLKEQKLMEVRNLLKEQMLKRFLLVRVFYTNFQIIGDKICSHVKGVDMELTKEVWAAITDLKHAGLRINKGNIGVVDEFNNMQFYKSCLKNPRSRVRNFFVGGLKLNESLIAFIITWMLTPRGNNHSIITKEDIVLIYCVMNKVKINWIHIIKEHTQKSIRLSDYHYPYAVLITKFIHYFKVDLEGEQSELVKTSSEINNGSLSKMGFNKIGGIWVSKEGEVGASSEAHVGEGNEGEVAATGNEFVGAHETSLSNVNMEERITSMSPFERLVVYRLDNFAHERRAHHEFCVAKF